MLRAENVPLIGLSIGLAGLGGLIGASWFQLEASDRAARAGCPDRPDHRPLPRRPRAGLGEDSAGDGRRLCRRLRPRVLELEHGMVRPCLVAVVIIVSAGCTGDLSAVNRTPVCAEEPALWTDADYQGLWDASGESARAALERWERDARCRVYLLRQQASEIAVDAEADVTALKAKAGQMTLKAAQVRDHLEGLLDNNFLAGNVACPTDATGERPQRRDSTTLAKVCVRSEDHTARLSKLLTTIESHAKFFGG